MSDKVREKWASLRKPARELEARKSATAVWWMMEWPQFWFTVILLTLVTWPLVAQVPHEYRRYLVIEGWMKAVPVYSIVFIIPMWVLPRMQISRNQRAMRDWIASLPFTVEYFEDALGQYARYGSLELELQFKGNSPDAATLRGFLEEPGATWHVNVSGNSAHLRREPGLGKPKTAVNRVLWNWFPKFVNRSVTQIHERVALDRLTFLP